MDTARSLWLDRRFRFLVIGGCNTASGYCVFAVIYYLLSPRVHYLLVLALATVVNVTISYLTQKFFVFRTSGNCLLEYLRFYLVYAVPIALGFVMFPMLVSGLGANPYLAQGLILLVTVVLSYLGHSRVSFRAVT